MKIKNIVISSFLLIAILVLPSQVNAVKIVLDAGHGGHDTGAINESKKIYEKTINLKIEQYLKSYLDEYENTEVILTRNDDTFLEIYDRSMIARNQKADLMISLHLNSATNTSINGAEVYVSNNTSLDKYKKQTSILGEKILTNLNKLGIANCGVKTRLIPTDETDIYSDGTRADYYGIIRYAMRGCKIDSGVIKPAGAIPAKVELGEGIPAMIIEHCFMSSNTDYQYINSDENIKKLAKADADAIAEHYSLKKKIVKQYRMKENMMIIGPDTTLKEIQATDPTATLVDSNSGMKTGAKIKIEEKEYTLVKLGDPSGDGDVNSADLLKIVKHLKGTAKLNDVCFKEAADVNQDKEINSADLLKIVKHLKEISKIEL